MLGRKNSNLNASIEHSDLSFDSFSNILDQLMNKSIDDIKVTFLEKFLSKEDLTLTIISEFESYFEGKGLIDLLKIKSFVSLFKNFYSLSVDLYVNVYKFIIDLMYLFKSKNSHIQVKYNDKILFQNSAGLYGFQKKEKATRYAKRIISKRFVDYFSKILFEEGDRINLILKGFRKPYKRSVRHLVSNLQFRLDNRYDKHYNYYKLLLKKKFMAKNYRGSGRTFLETNGQRLTEREVLYEKMRSRLYSFLYIKCFYISSTQMGGIRLRLKNKIPNKFY